MRKGKLPELSGHRFMHFLEISQVS